MLLFVIAVVAGVVVAALLAIVAAAGVVAVVALAIFVDDSDVDDLKFFSFHDAFSRKLSMAEISSKMWRTTVAHSQKGC